MARKTAKPAATRKVAAPITTGERIVATVVLKSTTRNNALINGARAGWILRENEDKRADARVLEIVALWNK